jgi:hypothetical protein
MEDEVTKNIDEILAGMYCSKNFKCAESGFERLCKAKYIGLERFLECLEANPADCSFAMPVGDQYYCDCPLRVYLERKLKKDRRGT